MIASMTGFTRHSLQKTWGSATCELRSVNHRYLELDLRLPETLRELEMPLRECMQSYLRRGKVECHIKYHLAVGSNQSFSINPQMIDHLAQARQTLSKSFGTEFNTSLTEILSWPGVLQYNDSPKENMHQDVLQLFEESLQDLVKMRQREGEATLRRINQRLEQVLVEVAKVKQRLPIVLQLHREKILGRIKEFNLTIDPVRTEEELLLLMQKMDVAEEIERLEIHVEEVRQCLQTPGSIGRRLDFLMQELHREANTLGSKSADSEVTHAGIHLKVLIEQMREQVQNVE